MSIWLAATLQMAHSDMVTGDFDLATSSKLADLSAMDRCGKQRDGEDVIVVCGNPHNQFRLPLPRENESLDSAHSRAQTGMAALTPAGPCGVFVGERQCSKKEAAEYGYGNGRDPLTVITRIAKKVVDPDAN